METPSSPEEPRDQHLNIRLTRSEKKRLNRAKKQQPLEAWSRETLLAAAPADPEAAS